MGMMKRCPCCKLPLVEAGKAFCFSSGGHHIAALICGRCADRHDRLPQRAIETQLAIAARNIERAPDRYAASIHSTRFEASALVALGADPATCRKVIDMLLHAPHNNVHQEPADQIPAPFKD